jgi:hypothetical protein
MQIAEPACGEGTLLEKVRLLHHFRGQLGEQRTHLSSVQMIAYRIDEFEQRVGGQTRQMLVGEKSPQGFHVAAAAFNFAACRCV